MLPTKAVRLQLGNLLAADTTTLAPANANHVALIKAPFVPSENLDPTMLTFADFDGSTPIAGTAGGQQVGIDPSTGDQVITILAPAGGWRWEVTGVHNLPQTIYGYALTNNTGATLYGTALLDAPMAFTDLTDFVDLGDVPINIVQQPMS
jgi:hypothetical protein